MIQNFNRALSPSAAGLMEKTDLLPAFGIDTDHGQPLSYVVIDLASNIAKLKVPLPGIGRVSQPRFQGFEVHSQRKIHIFQQPANRIARNLNPSTLQLLGDFLRGFARPFASSHRVSSSFVFHNRCNRLYDLRRFFSCNRRPAPVARTPLWVNSPVISSWRPRATVCGSMPRREAMCASPPWPSFKDSSPAYSRRCRSFSILQKRRIVALASSTAKSGLTMTTEAKERFK
mgnify:CR=1 FL=1